MAGIISNVESDVQNLRKLKNEIEQVKKALLGINIKVDIDIAKDLEAQLRSLTSQYDALVDKIAAAEGKIMLSTKRINEASEKIIQAQEKLSIAPSAVNAPSVEVSGVANIQAQTKAYADLKTEIDDILGTRDANVRRMIEEVNAIRLINAEIKKITKVQGDSASLSSAQQKRLEHLNNSLLTHKEALADVRRTLSNNVKLDNVAATSMNGLSQSLSRMRIAYRDLTEAERNSPFGKQLLASINQADAKIKELDATIGNHQRNIGNYGNTWNGLSMSIQQVGRELPSLAYGPKVFFSAISNNLPILADEIKRARTEYDMLKKSGQSAVPVWKQIASSLFSWQSALTVGITLLTLYGDKIVDWVAGLFGADRSQKKINESVKEFNSLIREEQYNTQILFGTIKKTNEGTVGRMNAIKKINDAYGKYLPYLLTEKSSLSEIEQAYKDVNKALMENMALKARNNSVDKVLEDSLKIQSDALYEIQKGAGKKNSKAVTDVVIGWTEDFYKAGQTWQRTFNAIAENIQKRFGKMPSGFYSALEDYIKNVYKTNKEIAKIQEKYNPFFEKKNIEGATVKNKTYWEGVRKMAEENLAKIASSQKTQMDAGNFMGIPQDVIDQYKRAMELKKEADRELLAYSSLTQAEKLRKESEKYNLLLDKQKHEQIRKSQDLENQLEQSEIDRMADGTEKTIRQRELNNKMEIQAVERQKEDYIKAIIQVEKDKFDAEEDIKASKDKNYKKKTFDASSVSVDASKFDEIISNTEERQKYDVYKAEADAMRNFLKEYGTFQQQKLAIAEEYAEKIRKAQSDGERRTLEKQRDAALLGVDVKAARQDIDWQSVFGDLGSMLRDQILPTIDNLKRITQSEEFRNSSIEDQQRIYDILSQLERQSGTLGKDMFKDVARDLELYRNSLNAYNAAKEREIKAAERLAEAHEKLRVAQDSGGDVPTAQRAVNEAQESFNQASESIKSLGEKASENAESLRTSSEKARGALDGLAGGLNSLRSGSLAQAFDGVKDIGKTLGGKIGNAIANIDPTGIIGGVLSILDILKDGFSSIFVSLQDLLYGAIEGVLNDVFSGDIIVKPIKNAMEHIGNILDTVTFGGFSSWIDSSNAKEVAETTERLTSSNERLRSAVDSLKDEMSKSGGWRAIDTAKQAKDDQQTINRQTMEILRTQMNYHSSHHSNAYYWGLNKSDYSELNKTLSNYAKKNNKDASRVGSLADIYKLTPEEMDYIRTYNVEMWKKMLEQGKYNKSEYWEQYANLAGKLEEITTALNETLTQMSFDSLRSSFIDSLMDMDKSAKDFANDFQEYMMKAILNAKISDLLDKDLKEFYEKWAAYSESDNKIEDWEKAGLSEMWNNITQKGLKIRDEVAAFTGYEKSFSQESTKKGFETMTQDQAGELNGRFTALQVSGEEMKLQSIAQSQSLNILTMKAEDILSISTDTRNIADDIRNTIADSYLELVQISENTGAIIKPIQQMQKDIAEVKRNTSKL